MKIRIGILCLVGTMLLIAGCNSTNRRIHNNQALFNSFPLVDQEKIRKGQVDIDFTKDMVLLALGEPDRKSIYQSKAGTVEFWSYYVWDGSGNIYYGLYHSPWRYGPYGAWGGVYYIDTPSRVRDHFRIGFGDDGKVKVIEKNTR